MKVLLILNDPPYGSERSYNALRLAKALLSKAEVILFLVADAVGCARRGQKVRQGFYNLELMLKSVLRSGQAYLCGVCMDARGLRDEDLLEGAQRSSMAALADLILDADRVINF
ncbi:MAG: DsrE family protein [Pseudomonadota bacterium]